MPKGKTIGFSVVRSEMSDCKLSEKSKLYDPYYLHHVELGDYSYISKNGNISYCQIGRYCSIGSNFVCGLGIHPAHGVSTSPMFYSTNCQNGYTVCNENKIVEHRNVVIGNDVWIGANVTVLDGVEIGDGAIIGAGAVVTKDIPPYGIAVGVPAKVIRYRFDEDTREGLLSRKWWLNENDQELVERYFFDVDKFLKQ